MTKRKQPSKANSSSNQSQEAIEGQNPLNQQIRICSLGVALVSCLIYSLTLYRSVPGGDSGELIQTVIHFGVPHPPGYPLYVLLAKLVSLVPIGSLATRINFFSALCDSAAAFLISLSVGRLTKNPWAGVLSGTLFAFSPLVWITAIAAEVFALNNLFISGLLYISVRTLEEGDLKKRVRLTTYAVFWTGLGLSNHHTFLFYAFPWCLFLLLRRNQEILKQRAILSWVGVFLFGLLPYLYLPLAGLSRGLDSWGDTSSLSGFFIHLLRMEYGTFRLANEGFGTVTPFIDKLWFFLTHLGYQTCYFGLPLAAFGLYQLTEKAKNPPLLLRGFGLCILISLGVYLCTFLSLSNIQFDFPLYLGIQMRFWQQPDLILFVAAGIGYATLLNKFKIKSSLISGLIACLAGALQLAFNYNHNDRSQAHVLEAFAHATLDVLPPRTLLISSGDHITHTLHYYQEQMQIRPDVLVIDHMRLTSPWFTPVIQKTYPEVSLPGSFLSPLKQAGTYNLKDFIDSNISKFPIFIVNQIRIQDDSHLKTYTTWPMGYLERVLPIERELHFSEWIESDRKIDALLDPVPLEVFPKESWEHEILRQYWHARHRFAGSLTNYFIAHKTHQPSIELAVQTLEAIQNYPEFTTPQVLKNTGTAYSNLALFHPEVKAKALENWKRYLLVAPPSDPDLTLIRDFIHP